MSYLFQPKQKSVQIRLMFNAFGHKLIELCLNAKVKDTRYYSC